MKTIDWARDGQIEQIRVVHLSSIKGMKGMAIRFFDYTTELLMILFIGVCLGLVVGIFYYYKGVLVVSEQYFSELRIGTCLSPFNQHSTCCGDEECSLLYLYPFPLSIILYVFLSLLFSWIAAFLVSTLSIHACGSGLPEVKTLLAGFEIHGFLDTNTLLVKCVGLVFAVSSGLSVGKEGPLVHIACCLAHLAMKCNATYRGNQAKQREILSAACAAGVACAFGAPIGGILFSLEEVSYYFPQRTMWISFTMAMIAAVSLQFFNPLHTGKLVLFQVGLKRPWFAFELPFFILLGMMGGLLGGLFIKWNIQVVKFRRSSFIIKFPVYEVCFIAVGTAFISFPFEFLKAPMTELVSNLFRECQDVDHDFNGLCLHDSIASLVFSLLFASIFKLLLTIITFGTFVPAGIFIPSMAIGACLGRAIGILIEAWHDSMPRLWLFQACPLSNCVTPGTYAIIGAAATLAGVTRMTVSLVVIIFELTGALSYVLPVMMVVLIARWVGDSIEKESIYDALIHLNGYPYFKDVLSAHSYAFEIMTPLNKIVSIQSNTTLLELFHIVNHKVQGFPVLESSTIVIGYISRTDLKNLLRDYKREPNLSKKVSFKKPDCSRQVLDFSDGMDLTPMMIHPKFRIEMVVEMFKKMGLRYVLLTRNGGLVGMITKKDLMRRFDQGSRRPSDGG